MVVKGTLGLYELPPPICTIEWRSCGLEPIIIANLMNSPTIVNIFENFAQIQSNSNIFFLVNLFTIRCYVYNENWYYGTRVHVDVISMLCAPRLLRASRRWALIPYCGVFVKRSRKYVFLPHTFSSHLYTYIYIVVVVFLLFYKNLKYVAQKLEKKNRIIRVSIFSANF